MLDKTSLVQAIIEALEAELAGYARSARSAQAEATDEQSKAENKYDTRGLEASYLARGQSRQASETAQALQQYRALAVAPGLSAVDLGALVEVEHAGARELYFMGPCAGGTEVRWEGNTVLVITPQSPLGRELLGRKPGERVTLSGRSPAEAYRLVAIQ